MVIGAGATSTIVGVYWVGLEVVEDCGGVVPRSPTSY